MTTCKPRSVFARKTAFQGVTVTIWAVLFSIVAASTTVQAQSRKPHPTGLASAGDHAIVDDGAARFICSPSGFGHLSTCTLRVSRLSGG